MKIRKSITNKKQKIKNKEWVDAFKKANKNENNNIIIEGKVPNVKYNEYLGNFEMPPNGAIYNKEENKYIEAIKNDKEEVEKIIKENNKQRWNRCVEGFENPKKYLGYNQHRQYVNIIKE